jgi:hypothetical protein
MELSFNYGTRRYFISDNWFYLLLFLFSLFVFLKQKKKNKTDIEGPEPISSLKVRGGDNSVTLQEFANQCLSDGSYLEVSDNKIKQIIRKMLNIEPGTTVIISTPIYLLALLKNNYAPLVLQRGGTKVIISNLRGFVSKGLGTILAAKLLALGSNAIIPYALPLILTALLYSGLHFDCNSYVSKLPTIDGNLPYIEAPIHKDDKVIVELEPNPNTRKILYHAFDENKVSSIDKLKCYLKSNCLGPEPRQRRHHFKPKRFIPLSERTKTLKDLKSPINERDEIDINNVNFKSRKEKE